MRASVLILLVPVSLVAYGGFLYYRLAWLHHQSRKALLHVEAQLNKHHDHIPHLLTALSDYLHHEKEILDMVFHARIKSLAAATVEERIIASAHLSHALHHFLRLTESCPVLDTDDETALIHMHVVLAEQKIALARDYYNHVIQHYNERLDCFPSNLLAQATGFRRKTPFELDFTPMEC